jgi:recombinational DNA repair protein RecT
MCDGITGHASLVPFRQGKSPDGSWKPSKATLSPGYKGLMDLVRRTGQCEPTMESVHEGDTYQYRGRMQEPLHIRSNDPNRRQRPITHAYVIGYFTNGLRKCFSWTVEECIAHRDAHCKNWLNAKKYVKPDELKANLWHEENPGFPVMCMKSVMRHAINRGEFPISVKDMRLLAQEDEPIEGHVVPGQGVTQEEAASLAFDSPAGYSETLHQEPVAGYAVESPGDEIARDAEQHLAEQTLPDAPPVECEMAISEAGTEDDVKRLVAEWDAMLSSDTQRKQARVWANQRVAQLRSLKRRKE